MKDLPYKERREKFFNQIENAVAIVPSNSEVIRNDDVHYKFRQDSSFFYLTGFDEPDSYAVFRNIGGKKEYILYVRPRDKEREIWDGYRAGVDGAVKKYGADRAHVVGDFKGHFADLFKGADRVYYTLRTRSENHVLAMLDDYRRAQGRSGKGLLPIHDVKEIIGEMRIRKGPEELDRLRKAGAIAAEAHKLAMMCCQPGVYEYQVEALIEYCFKMNGSERIGYGSIVASGSNSTILHYVNNDQRLKEGDLLLIDAGAEYNYLTSDITRTFPVSGEFSPQQRRIYDIVLDVQKSCLALAKPGTTLVQIHNHAVERLTEAMIDLKFLSGNRDDLIRSLAYKRFYPHGTGHLLGMDVHDIGLYTIDGKPRPLEPGMVFTIEPGFYVQPDDESVPSEYRGIGVRIEDDVVITASGCEVLTADVPKEADEMCALIGTKPWPTLT
jgi:Xaa-Pro aminopeptidase